MRRRTQGPWSGRSGTLVPATAIAPAGILSGVITGRGIVPTHIRWRPALPRGRRQQEVTGQTMERFRSTWLALIGGALLIALSVSAAFGAPPASTQDETRGQTIAGFVHELVFGTDEEEPPVAEDELECDLETDPECEVPEECDSVTGPDECEPVDEECDPETDAEACEVEEDAEEDADEEADDEDGEEADGNAHGQCVAEEASDKSDETEEDGNHGSVVSEAARDTCWTTGEDSEETDEEAADDEEDDDADSHGACVSAVAHDKGGENDPEGSEYRNHGERVSEAARLLCRDPDGEEEAEADGGDAASSEDQDGGSGKPERTGGGKPSWAGNGGRGGGRP